MGSNPTPSAMVDSFELAMEFAIVQAELALQHGEVPVGAVVLHEGRIIAARHNEREERNDPTAHAEILAIRDASEVLGRWRLFDCDLVVTLEPCLMCAGALINSRIRTLAYGTSDPKAGAAGSLYNFFADPRLNHNPKIIHSVKLKETKSLLETFFLQKRRFQK